MTVGVRPTRLAVLLTVTLALVPALSPPAAPRSPTPVAQAAPPAAPRPPRRLMIQTPDMVVHRRARLRGRHNPHDVLTLSIGLGVHNSARLDAIIWAASEPGSPQYGHYLTHAQYMAQFAPTSPEVAAVRAWATAAGLAVHSVSADHLLVKVSGAASQVERALGVDLNDYSMPDRTFMSNDRDPTVPAGLNISAITGLNTVDRVHSVRSRLPMVPAGGYTPNSFQSAYNAGPIADGSGQTIGLTLWGGPIAQPDLTTFADNALTLLLISRQPGQNGPNVIEWLPVDGGSTDTHDLKEQAMDVEYAHAMAPNSHLKFWLGPCTYDPTTRNCNIPAAIETQVLLDILNAAANDLSVSIVSNSWEVDTTSGTDSFVIQANPILQEAAALGKTFYFASGDEGSNEGNAEFPASSPYVVAVGGTTLSTGTNSSYSVESAWSGSGGGCTTDFQRPFWQTMAQGNLHVASCPGRAEPDVAAAADPNTGAYVYYNGQHYQVGGTSLATPLWAGMAADLDHDLQANNQPLMGFAAPHLYRLATNAVTYNRDFHDVQSGTNGLYGAGRGWDEVTGWGSPNLANLATDWASAATLAWGRNDFGQLGMGSPSTSGCFCGPPHAGDRLAPCDSRGRG